MVFGWSQDFGGGLGGGFEDGLGVYCVGVVLEVVLRVIFLVVIGILL